MGSGKKYMYCAVCGAPFYRRASRPGKSLCMTHAMANMAENARQLNTHTGPYWAKWLDGVTDMVARLNAEAIADSVPDGLDAAGALETASGVPRARGREARGGLGRRPRHTAIPPGPRPGPHRWEATGNARRPYAAPAFVHIPSTGPCL